MNNQNLNRELDRLDNLFEQTAVASRHTIEMQAHWARYLCIICAGFIENGIAELYGEFVKSAASEPVARFAGRSLSRIRNPKTGKFLETAEAFNKKWKEDLKLFTEEEGRKEAIDSIMTNRHRIAHGKNSDISIVRLKEWFSKSLEVLDYIEQQCNVGN